MADGDGPPRVAVPERLDRRLRLGPFPSGREALGFVTGAAIGGILALVAGPWAGVPVVLLASALTMARPGHEPLHERLGPLLRWTGRRLARGNRVTGPERASPTRRRSTVRLEDGRLAGIVRTGGVPLAYLPPDELARTFEQYRELLRSLDGSLAIVATSAPIFANALAPAEPAPVGTERKARDGYAELVGLLARRRSVRRVYVAVAVEGAGPEDHGRLESSIAALRDRLAGLGLRPERLRDRALEDASRKMGLGERSSRG